MKLLLFFSFPFLEMYLWVQFMQVYSFWDAFFIILSSGFVGLFIMIMQGRSALMTLQLSLVQGKSPEKAVLHKAVVMFGGFLIFLPGLMTKTFGTLLVLPGIRHALVAYLRLLLVKQMGIGLFKFFSSMGNRGAGSAGGADGFQSGFSYQWSTSQKSNQERDVVEVTPITVTHSDVPNNVIDINSKKDT